MEENTSDCVIPETPCQQISKSAYYCVRQDQEEPFTHQLNSLILTYVYVKSYVYKEKEMNWLLWYFILFQKHPWLVLLLNTVLVGHFTGQNYHLFPYFK